MTTPHDTQPDTGALYEEAAAGTRRYIAGLRADQWDNATPCDDWNVRQVVNHIVGTARNAKNLLEGEEYLVSAGVDLLGDDPLGAFDRAVEVRSRPFALHERRIAW